METTNNLKITAQLSQQINTLDDSESATQSPNPPGVYSVKMLVRISGTGEDGLRIRANAGLNEVTMFLGSEGEVFEIIDGPEIIDNSIWWKIQAIDNHSKFGWAVQVYLSQY
jgi:hypothetical protein